MLEKYKVFVRGSTETKKILGEIAEKRNICVSGYEISDNSDYQFGKCPSEYDDFNIWIAGPMAPTFFIRYGYKEVTPQQFREIWLEESPKKENESKAFCCKGCEKLREVCQRLAKEGFVNPSEHNNFESTKEGYHFIDHKTVVHYVNGSSYGEIVSPEEFYERIAGKPWEEKKVFIGFIGDSHVKISLLPTEIKNPKHLKGNARSCIFYVENNELTYCVIGEEPKDKCFEIVSYTEFRLMTPFLTNTGSRQYEKLESEYPLTLEDCFESKQKTKETNLVQSSVKTPSENFLQLSEEKPLKIIL